MEIRHAILLIFVSSAVYVYFRGRVRFSVMRSLTDYVVLLAPVNSLLYLFSKVKAGAYIPVTEFPELKKLQDNWEMIRAEALALNEGGSIAAATGYNDIGFNSFFSYRLETLSSVLVRERFSLCRSGLPQNRSST